MSEEIRRDKFPSSGGWKYRQPQFGNWENKMALVGFDASVTEIRNARLRNKALSIKHNLSTDPDTIAHELIQYNRRIRSIPDPSPPSFFQTARQKLSVLIDAAAGDVKKMWIGADTVMDCAKDSPASSDLSSQRALVCCGKTDSDKCPKNGRGDMTRWFTMPLSEAIRRAESKLRKQNLSTPYDDRLGVCEACLCPLKLKVHCSPDVIQKHLIEHVRSELDPRCWILSESK